MKERNNIFRCFCRYLIASSLLFFCYCSVNLSDRYGFMEIENNTGFRIEVKSPGVRFYFEPDTGERIDVKFDRLFVLEPFKKRRIQVRVGPYSIEAVVPYKFSKKYTVNIYENQAGSVIIYE